MAIVDKTPTSPYSALFLSQCRHYFRDVISARIIFLMVTSFLPRWRHFCHGDVIFAAVASFLPR